MKARGIVAVLGFVAAGGAHADTAATMQAVYRDWMVPHAAELAATSAQLTSALQGYCAASSQDADPALGRVREGWRTSLVEWERLSTVAVGPVLDDRMPMQLDFNPTRPPLIARAVKAAPSEPADMERIGTPAKGFPALEWLLWTKPMRPASPECRYAVQVAMEIERSAQSVERDFRELAGDAMDAAAAKGALDELVNQWVGGLEHLRWADMGKPLEKAATVKPKGAPEFPRHASDTAAQSWAARWQTLRALAADDGPGSIASLLRDRGKGKLADALDGAVAKANAGMTGLDPADPSKVEGAVRDLSALKRLVEHDVAAALDVNIGFSDSDGD